ncbi:hypothetical protein ABPG75_000159 [Micractinium tetrahymenae]
MTHPVALPVSSLRPLAVQQCRPAPARRRLAVAASLGNGSAAEHNARNTTALQGKLVDALTLFTQEYLMTVPYAQRPYLWSEGVAEQLLEDLVTMAGAAGSTDMPELPDYPLGSINLLGEPAGSGAFTKKYVYDGQQRIVTLCLLLSALRERLEAAAQGEEGLHAAEREACQKVAKSPGAESAPGGGLSHRAPPAAPHLSARAEGFCRAGAVLPCHPMLRRRSHARCSLPVTPQLPRILPPCMQDTDFLAKLLTDTDFLARSDIVPDGSQQLRLMENMQSSARCTQHGKRLRVPA